MNMEDHITFEEISEFFFPSEVNESYLKTVARVNSHAMQCPLCKKRYAALLKYADTVDLKRSAMEQNEKNNLFVLRALCSLKATSQEMENAIASCIEHIQSLSTYVLVKIKDFSEIVVDSMSSGINYRYPAFSTVPKSAGSSGQTTGIIKSSVVSDADNRISIGLDGTLSLYFNRETCDEKSWVLLAPTGEHQIPYYKRLERYDDHQYVARFFDITPGEYLVILQNQN